MHSATIVAALCVFGLMASAAPTVDSRQAGPAAVAAANLRGQRSLQNLNEGTNVLNAALSRKASSISFAVADRVLCQNFPNTICN
jgi:hypothetical protein